MYNGYFHFLEHSFYNHMPPKLSATHQTGDQGSIRGQSSLLEIPISLKLFILSKLLNETFVLFGGFVVIDANKQDVVCEVFDGVGVILLFYLV